MKPAKRPAPLAFQLIVCFILIALLMPMLGATFITNQIRKEQVLVLKWYGTPKGTVINDRADRWFRLWAVDSGLMSRTIHGEAAVNNAAHEVMHPFRTAAQNQAQSGNNDPDNSSLQIAPTIDTSKALKVEDSKHRFSTNGVPPPSQQAGRTGETSSFAPQHPSNASRGAATPAFSPMKLGAVHHIWERWITAVFAIAYFTMLRLSAFVSLLPMLLPILAAVLITGGAVRKLKWHGFGGVSTLQYRSGIRMWGWLGALAVGMLVAPGALPPVMVGLCLLLSCVGVAMATANRQKPA